MLYELLVMAQLLIMVVAVWNGFELRIGDNVSFGIVGLKTLFRR